MRLRKIPEATRNDERFEAKRPATAVPGCSRRDSANGIHSFALSITRAARREVNEDCMGCAVPVDGLRPVRFFFFFFFFFFFLKKKV